MSASKSQSSSSLASARGTAVQVIVSALVLGALWWALQPVIGQQVTILVVLSMAVLGYIVEKTGEFSIPFWLSFAGVLGLVVEFLVPGFIVQQFDPLIDSLRAATGLDLGEFDAFQFFVLSSVAIVVIWVVSARFGLEGYRKAKKPTTVANRVRKRAEKLVDTYFTIGRIAAAFTVAVFIIGFRQGGELAGDIGGQLAEVPFIVSNVVTAILGFLSLGGELPILSRIPLLSSLSSAEFAVLVLGVIIVAAGVKYS